MEQIGNYRVVRLLGRGGMGSVYEVRHATIERRAAIKLLHKDLCTDPDVLKRFVNEARAVNIIGHSGLVGVSEFGQTEEGAPYIVMEYIDGITLREHITRSGGRLPIDQVVRLSRQIASTLAAAHAKQIVHRDLKPVNIMLVTDTEGGTEERVKVLDFGIAKLNSESSSQTKSGILMGTPAYMSPEQCRGGRNAVDRSDIYALGIIMYELLAGETPFRGGPAVMMAMHLSTPPEPLITRAPNTPLWLCDLIHRMLAKSASDRPTASEVVQSLTAVDGKGPVLSAIPAVAARTGTRAPSSITEAATELRPLSSPQQPPPPDSRFTIGPVKVRGSRIVLLAAVVLAVGAGGLLALLIATSRGTPRGSADGRPDASVDAAPGAPGRSLLAPADMSAPAVNRAAPGGPAQPPPRAEGENKRSGGARGAHRGPKKPDARSGPHRSTR